MTDANGATNFTQQFAINGQRGVEATFTMDGADISDPEMGGATFTNFNVDAVEEIQSSSGWMPADVGRGASGFTNIVTRSGASGFHGSLFEFVRNSVFDARNFFDYPTPAYPGRIPSFRRNEFGLTNGGPVYLPHVYDGRGRTFYFVEYQGFRQAQGKHRSCRCQLQPSVRASTPSPTPTAQSYLECARRSGYCGGAQALSPAQRYCWLLRRKYLPDRLADAD